MWSFFAAVVSLRGALGGSPLFGGAASIMWRFGGGVIASAGAECSLFNAILTAFPKSVSTMSAGGSWNCTLLTYIVLSSSSSGDSIDD